MKSLSLVLIPFVFYQCIQAQTELQLPPAQSMPAPEAPLPPNPPLQSFSPPPSPPEVQVKQVPTVQKEPETTAKKVQKSPSIGYYKQGHHPVGTIYKVPQLKKLVGQKLTQPAYLVGEFICIGVRKDRYLFVPFTLGPTAYLKMFSGDQLTHGDILKGQTQIEVIFHNNKPSGLIQGKAFKLNASDPLILKKVVQTASGLLVQTDYLGEP